MEDKIIGNSLPKLQKVAIIEMYIHNPYNIKGICQKFKITPALIFDCINEYNGKEEQDRIIPTEWQTD